MYYNSLNNYLKQKFGCKVYKLSLNAGLSCPNRDGSISFGGCIFCSEGGSGDFAGNPLLSIPEQIEKTKSKVSNKMTSGKYIAYFQAYTNTYGPIEYLRKIYSEAIHHPDIVAISIGTRPDCLSDEIISLLSDLNKIKPVWIELGLQTIHEKTASFINRGYNLNCFTDSVLKLNKAGIDIIVHLILGLPGETNNDILESVRFVSSLNIQGIKLQLLHVLKNTKLADMYNTAPFKIFTLEEYISLLARCLEIIPENIVIHRLTGDGPKSLLIAPLWSGNKKVVLNTLNKYLSDNNIIQGSKSVQKNTPDY